MKIKMGDKVVVITGKNRAKTGKVLRVNKKLNKIVVEKVNIRTKHIKKQKSGGTGQIIHYEAPIDASNAAVICPNCDKKTKVSYSRTKEGIKQRICKKCHQGLDAKIEKKKVKRK